MNIDSLLKEAFFEGDAFSATPIIETARARVSAEANVDGFSFEVVVPDEADADWLRERVLRPLIYFGESAGMPPPACPGVFVTFFRGDRVYCVLGAEVIAWAAQQLGADEQALIREYGPGEREGAAPRAPA